MLLLLGLQLQTAPHNQRKAEVNAKEEKQGELLCTS
jgi:hypothetical protein